MGVVIKGISTRETKMLLSWKINLEPGSSHRPKCIAIILNAIWLVYFQIILTSSVPYESYGICFYDTGAQVSKGPNKSP